MRVLLDSHTLLWWILDDPALTPRASDAIAEARDAVLVSAATAWELAIKFQLGRLPMASDLIANFSNVVDNEKFQVLSVSADHGIRAGTLPLIHKDPFDRLLAAQAQAENVLIVSNDLIFEAYGVRRLW